MVDLTSSDYKKIFGWFERTFGITTEPDEIPLEDKRVFWKLTFLAEDRTVVCRSSHQHYQPRADTVWPAVLFHLE